MARNSEGELPLQEQGGMLQAALLVEDDTVHAE
jgi:hypothetical protein